MHVITRADPGFTERRFEMTVEPSSVSSVNNHIDVFNCNHCKSEV